MSDFAQASLPGEQPVITNIRRDFTQEALGQLAQEMALMMQIPIEQVLGYRRTIVQSSDLAGGTASTASTTYTSVGPSITDIPPGKYLVLIRANMFSSSPGSSGGDFGVDLNGSGTAIVAVVHPSLANLTTHMAFEIQNMTAASNTLNGILKSRNALETINAEARQIFAYRIGETA